MTLAGTDNVEEDATALLAIKHLAKKYPASFEFIARNCNVNKT